MSTGRKVQAERDQPRLDLPTTPVPPVDSPVPEPVPATKAESTLPPRPVGPATKGDTFADTLTALVEIEQAEARLHREKLLLRSTLLNTADYQLINPDAVPGSNRPHARADCADIGSDTWLQNIDLAAAELAAATHISTSRAEHQLGAASYYTRHFAVAVASLDPDGEPYHGLTAEKLEIFFEHTADLRDAELQKVDARVLPHAGTDTPGQFTRRLRRAIIAVTGTNKHKERRARAVKDRYVGFDSDSITGRIFGRLPIACARALDTALDDLARSGDLPGDARTHQQRRIDALIACVLGPAAMIRPAGHPAYGGAAPGAAAWDADGQYIITDPDEPAEAGAVMDKIRALAATINLTIPVLPEVTIRVTIPAHLLAGSDLAGTNTSTGTSTGTNASTGAGGGEAATSQAAADAEESDDAIDADTAENPENSDDPANADHAADAATNRAVADDAEAAGDAAGTDRAQTGPGGSTDSDDSDAEPSEDPHRWAVAAIDGLGPIDADLARHLAKDARWQRVITDPHTGAILDVGTKIYRPPAQMRRRVIERDHTCRFPGCARRAVRCDVDHINPHRPDGTGGTTGDCNLIALCRRHHRLKHQTNWRVTLRDDTGCEWISPAGQKYLTYPTDTDPPPQRT